MQQTNLWKIQEKEIITVFYDGPDACADCGQSFNGMAYHFITWLSGGRYYVQVLCHKHLSKAYSNVGVQEQRRVLVVDEPPKGSIPMFLNPPSLVDSRMTVFEAATRLGGVTVDHARRSERLMIGARDDEKKMIGDG